MRIVERPDVKGGYVPCVNCGCGTRSHVLETAEYEEYEEVWEEELEEYQHRKKKVDEEEEETVVIRYRLHSQKTCMCHRCWLNKKEKAVKFMNKHKETWISEPTSYMTRIKKFLKSWNYYGFDKDLTDDEFTIVNKIRNALIGGEEE